MGDRQYLPVLGRFLEVDPVENGTGTNDYAYVADPINDQDLNGRGCDRWDVWCLAKRGGTYIVGGVVTLTAGVRTVEERFLDILRSTIKVAKLGKEVTGIIAAFTQLAFDLWSGGLSWEDLAVRSMLAGLAGILGAWMANVGAGLFCFATAVGCILAVALLAGLASGAGASLLSEWLGYGYL